MTYAQLKDVKKLEWAIYEENPMGALCISCKHKGVIGIEVLKQACLALYVQDCPRVKECVINGNTNTI